MPQIGPYSRPHVLAKMDGRTREARLLREIRADLTAHVGGRPSATQRALIERAAWLTLHTSQLDAKAAESRVYSPHDNRTYLAWSNSLTRTLRALGLEQKQQQPKSLADHMAGRAA